MDTWTSSLYRNDRGDDRWKGIHRAPAQPVFARPAVAWTVFAAAMTGAAVTPTVYVMHQRAQLWEHPPARPVNARLRPVIPEPAPSTPVRIEPTRRQISPPPVAPVILALKSDPPAPAAKTPEARNPLPVGQGIPAVLPRSGTA
jgi:hypothetical protein